jgi:hypothetical protein
MIEPHPLEGTMRSRRSAAARCCGREGPSRVSA